MKYLAIDFGEKRIGLATSDASGRIATPRRTLVRKSDAIVLDEIVAFLRREEVGEIVLGVPYHSDGREHALAARIRSFGRKLEKASGLPVRTVDEHLTSWEAQSRPAGPAGLDAGAAAVILEDFLAGQGH